MVRLRVGRSTLFLLFALTACGKGDEAENTPASAANTPAPVRLTEAEVVGTVLSAADALAVTDSVSATLLSQPGVIRYAQILHADHRAIGQEIQAVADTIKIAGARSEVGERIRTSATDLMSALQDSAADRTSVFLTKQIEIQRMLIGAMDSTLIPAAVNPQLRQVLQDLRPAMIAHLQRAEQIQEYLATIAITSPRQGAASISPESAKVRVDSSAAGVRRDTIAPPDTAR